METSDQNPSPTVFDLPPRETESLEEAVSTDWLQRLQRKESPAVEEGHAGGAPDFQAPASSATAPEAPAAATAEGPWFARYVEPEVAAHDSHEEPAAPEADAGSYFLPPPEEPHAYAPIRIRPLMYEPDPEEAVDASLTSYEHPHVHEMVPETHPIEAESPGDPAAQQLAPTITDRVPTVEEPVLPRVTRRKPLLSEDMDMSAGRSEMEQPSVAPISYMVNSPRPVNQRRGTKASKLVGLAFVANLLILAAFGAWHYDHLSTELETRIADALATQSSRPFPSTLRPGLPPADSASPELSKLDEQLRQAQARLAEAEEQNQVHAAQLKELSSAVKNSEAGQAKAAAAPASATKKDGKVEEALANQSADLKSQLQTAQQRLAEAEKKNQQQAARLDELATAVADVVASKQALAPELGSSPTQSELVLLKERNRLTAYADEAIATGERVPYERLWEAIDDPRLATLVHAARAEILRVQHFFVSGSRLEWYVIPVSAYFPESAALKDNQLSDAQLISLLSNFKHPWEVRFKAANLLGRRPSKVVGDALVKAVETDPNLDVIKEATFSFEQITHFRGKLFEPAPMIAWWKEFNAKPPASDPKATAAPPSPAAKPPEPAAKPSDPKPAGEAQAAAVPAPAPTPEAKP